MRALLWGCCLAGGLLAGETATSLADFEGADPLAGWKFSTDRKFPGGNGSFAVGRGHTGQGAVLSYQFACVAGSPCGGAATAVWTPAKPVAAKRRAALSMWIRASAEVKLTLLVHDKSGESKRYPFEVTTLEHSGGDWRQVVIPLAAESTGYGDEEHTGAPEGRLISLGILAEARYPVAMHGAVAFDDVALLETPDRTFTLSPAMSLSSAPPNAAQLTPRLGINIHTLNDDSLLDLARDAGFGFVRVDLLWRDVERNGRFRFAAYDRLLSALESRGMGALWILDYGHPQHGGDPPRRPDDVAAFARFAGATAAHFRGRNVRFEIWNEPDTERFWPPKPRASEYAALLREAAAAIHEADPAAQVASGGLARIDVAFLEQTIDAGGSGEDAVGVHPYRKAGPEGLAAELPLLRQFLAQKAGKDVAIWDTEWGYASYDFFSQNLRGDGHSAQGRQRQAVLACREALTIWALGLPVAVWYDLRDDGEEPRNPEHNYGLVDKQNLDKPAMKAIRTLTHVAAARIYAGMAPDLPDGVHALRMDGAADKIFVVWNEQPDARITMRFPGLVSATNLLGDPLKLKSAHGVAELPLAETGGPVYLTFKN